MPDLISTNLENTTTTFIENFDAIDLKSAKKFSKFTFYCKACNQLTEKYFYRLNINKKLLCTKCLRLESYKNRSTEEKQKSLEKYKQSCLKHFGTKFPIQNRQIKEKIKQTCLNRYGSECVVGSKYAEEKRKQTCQQKYGKDYYLQTTQSREKARLTSLKKYGVENTNQSSEVKLKKENTFLRKYNTTNPFKSKEIQEKIKKTNLEKFGVESYSQTHLARKTRRNVYKLDNQIFDSKIELAFYIYHRDQNSNIKRNTKSFEYIFENKKHYYFPDFEIDGKFYEIKGNQFLKEDGSWQNPFDHSQDGLYEAKHQCALRNNVIILYSVDCKSYVNYVKEKYEQNYLKSVEKI